VIYALNYSEKPDYDLIKKLFIDELLQLDYAPQVANYDWVRNPCFLKPGYDSIEPFVNDIISDESFEMEETNFDEFGEGDCGP